QVQRRALPAELVSIVKTRDRIDVVGGKGRADLDAKIGNRHELELELLSVGLVAAAVLGKPAGGLALEFALAALADIRADHEAVDVFGVDAFFRPRERLQQPKAECRRP